MHRQSESLAALAPALVEFQSQVHGATKNATNPHLRNKYADLASIWEAIREPLTQNGLGVLQLPAPGDNGSLRLVTRLLHSSGEWIESEIAMPLGKQDPQGYGSALTYARRYALAALLGIVQEDDDAEGAVRRDTTPKDAPAKVQRLNGGKTPEGTPGGSTADQQKQIGVLIAELGWNTKGAVGWLEKHFQVKTRAELNKIQALLALVDLVNRVDCSEKPPSQEAKAIIEAVTANPNYSTLLAQVEALGADEVA